MKKRVLLGLLAAGAAAGALASCNGANLNEDTFVVQCWNDEYRAFFNKYSTDEGKALLKEGKVMDADKAKTTLTGLHIDGLPVKFVETPSADGAYQQTLDAALKANATAVKTKKVDMFLAEADYIVKYADSTYTQDISTLGTAVTQTNVYGYTKQAASDSNGKVKGVSFQCCPSGMIYNRVVAKAVYGTDDPATIQDKFDTWEKFEAEAANLKAKGYYITASTDDTYRVFANNSSTAWINNDELAIVDGAEKWLAQTETFVKNEYTVISGVWDNAKKANIAADANTAFCTFGPAWYYNFCMGDSKMGDWAVVKGPEAHFWGGTWMMAATGTDNPEVVAKVMNQFLNDNETLTNLSKNEGQFVNNSAFNVEYAKTNTAGNEFLGGQNDTALWVSMTDSIVWKNHTMYDQDTNEKFTGYYADYFKGQVDKAQALQNFYDYMTGKFANLKVKK